MGNTFMKKDIMSKTSNFNEVETALYSEDKAGKNSDDETMTCLKEFDEIYDHMCKKNIQIDADGPDVDIESINLNYLDTALDGELNVDIFESFEKYEDVIDIVEQNNDEPSFKKPDTEVPTLLSSRPIVEYNKTECSSKVTIKNTSHENGRPKEELLFNNIKCVESIDIIELPTQDLQYKIGNINVPATYADEFSEQGPELKSKECLNKVAKIGTNEFTRTTISLDDDCDGYHSSDFEFIDEDEAKKCPNFILTLDEAVEKNTVDGGDKQPERVNVYKRAAASKKGATNKKRAVIRKLINEAFTENVDKPATINKANTERVLKENENLNDDAENEMLYYLKTLQAPMNEQFIKDYRELHRIPNDEEYLHLFSGIYSPYLMYAMHGANKDMSPGMYVDRQEMGFNVNKFVDDITPEQRKLTIFVLVLIFSCFFFRALTLLSYNFDCDMLDVY